MWDMLVAFINDNWSSIVHFMQKLWAWAKETILAPGPFETEPTTEEE